MWVLEDNEIEALGAAQKRNLRETVINHAQDKLRFPPGVDPTQTRGMLGRVDKRDSQDVLNVIQAGICDGDQLGTRPDV